jgi:hypothetical protein
MSEAVPSHRESITSIKVAKVLPLATKVTLLLKRYSVFMATRLGRSTTDQSPVSSRIKSELLRSTTLDVG